MFWFISLLNISSKFSFYLFIYFSAVNSFYIRLTVLAVLLIVAAVILMVVQKKSKKLKGTFYTISHHLRLHLFFVSTFHLHTHARTQTHTQSERDTQRQMNVCCFEGGVGVKDSNTSFPGEELQMKDVSEQDLVWNTFYLFVNLMFHVVFKKKLHHLQQLTNKSMCHFLCKRMWEIWVSRC